MKTIATKTFKRPFVLTEQELRRIHDILDQQIKRVVPAGNVAATYELTFANGAIANPTSLDEIFAQENLGSKAIRAVELAVNEAPHPPSVRPIDDHNSIKVEFVIPEEGDKVSVRYEIRGEDRDWVFVSSSQLDERIGRVIGTFSFERLNAKGLASGVVILVALLTMLLALSFMLEAIGQSEQKHQTELQKLYSDYQGGKIKDQFALLFEFERLNISLQHIDPMGPFIVKAAGVGVVAMIVVLGGPLLWKYFSPPYNFVWGDYQTVFEKRRARGRFILVGVILAVVVSIVANVLTKKIGF